MFPKTLQTSNSAEQHFFQRRQSPASFCQLKRGRRSTTLHVTDEGDDGKVEGRKNRLGRPENVDGDAEDERRIVEHVQHPETSRRTGTRPDQRWSGGSRFRPLQLRRRIAERPPSDLGRRAVDGRVEKEAEEREKRLSSTSQSNQGIVQQEGVPVSCGTKIHWRSRKEIFWRWNFWYIFSLSSTNSVSEDQIDF